MKEIKDGQIESFEDFALETDAPPEFTEVDFLQEIADHDFNSDEPTDFDKYFNVLESAEKDNQEFKNQEADYIIAEIGDTYLDQDYLAELNKAKDNLKAFMKKHSGDSEIIKKMTEQEKDKVFAVGKFLNKYLTQKINELKFTFSFTIPEYKFIQQALRSKMSYDGTEVFNMIELKETYLDQWDQTYSEIKQTKGISSFYVTIDIRNVVMLYHFLSKYSVKGIGEEFYNFVTVLKKISDTNKLFNAYNVIKERMNSEYFVWSGSITPVEANDVDLRISDEEQSAAAKPVKGKRAPKEDKNKE